MTSLEKILLIFQISRNISKVKILDDLDVDYRLIK